jgi:hypothetical protein
MPEPIYAGDGVYASFDGTFIHLHLNSHYDHDRLIAIEPEVMQRLIEYARECWPAFRRSPETS